ncbi:MAG TPA: amidohydrolase family protein, partial [Dehalococcoidia bacterium]|nr:amidohydrolase family protein [Dehalococcoidia bacterium]
MNNHAPTNGIRLLIRGGRLLDPSQGLDNTGDLLVEGGRIAAVGAPGSLGGEEVFPAEGLIVCPGFIDLHCHLREPGFEEKETIATGTAAAAAGGFTTVCCMPNTEPPMDRAAVVEYVQKTARLEGRVRVLPIGSVSRGRKGEHLTEMAELVQAGAVAFSDDGSPVASARLMRSALEYSSMLGVPIIDHCQEPALSLGAVVHEGWVSTVLGLRGEPAASEEVMVERDLVLAELTGGWVHIAHVSTAGSVERIRRAKA